MNPRYRLTSTQAEAVVHLTEAAPQIQRRSQFFLWLQGPLQALLPHQIAICGAYQRQRRELVFESLNSVPLPGAALSSLTEPTSPLLLALQRQWIGQRGQPLQVALPTLGESGGVEGRAAAQSLCESGIEQLLVHGVSRPQRPGDVECLFIFGALHRPLPAGAAVCIELVLPQLQATYLRVQSVERELGLPIMAPGLPRAPLGRPPITEREKQILAWVREGKSNQQIGEQLDISSLTVKNHVQKILRKLGAANRAQAVAKAMTMNLLPLGASC